MQGPKRRVMRRMVQTLALPVLAGLALSAACRSRGSARPEDEVVFSDDFQSKLAAGWSWIRQDAAAWRLDRSTPRKGALEIRVQPGNMWGPTNDAKNVLVRPLPDAAGGTLEVSVSVTNQPTHQYEQADLVWYYDDAHMVKI